MTVRLSDSDGHTERLVGVLYRLTDGDGWSDGQVYMVDEWSDVVCRRLDGDRLSNGQIVGLKGGVTD